MLPALFRARTRSAAIRPLVLARAVVVVFGVGAAANGIAAESNTTRGSTKGLLVDQPVWSAGVQLGNGGSTGPVVQRFGVLGGAVNGGVGFHRGDATVVADWLLFLDEDLDRIAMGNAAGYNAFRGRILPYFGAGLMAGSGVGLRLPLGAQYTMLKDPFNFYAGGALTVAHYRKTKESVSLDFWIQIGARLLL